MVSVATDYTVLYKNIAGNSWYEICEVILKSISEWYWMVLMQPETKYKNVFDIMECQTVSWNYECLKTEICYKRISFSRFFLDET